MLIQVVFLAIAVITILLWILGGISYFKSGSKWIRVFILHILAFGAIVFALWYVIVYPILDCKTFLCGLGEILIFFALTILTAMVWGIYLYTSGKRKAQSSFREEEDQDILDGTF